MSNTSVSRAQTEDDERRNAAALALGAVLIGLPFFSNAPVDYDRLAPLLLLLPVWLGHRWLFIRRNATFPVPAECWLIVALGAVSLVSSLSGSHPASSLVMLAASTWVFVGAWLARRLSADAHASTVILAAIAISSALGCVAVWAAWKTGVSSPGATPHYGHIRLFGLHMMIGSLASIGWLMHPNERRLERLLAGTIAVIACAGMLWSGGRAPMVGFAAGAVFWFAIAQKAERRFLLRALPAVVLGGLLLSALKWSPEPYLGWWGAFSRTLAAGSVDELSSTRLSFWEVTWRAYLGSPWIGSGLDSYRFITPKQDGSQPHNWILQWLLDTGLVGATCVVLLLGLQLVRAFRHRARTTTDPFHRSDQRTAAAALAAALAAGLFDGVLYHASLLVPTAILAGLAGRAADETAPLSSAFRPLGLLLGAAALVLGIHSVLVARIFSSQPPGGPNDPTPRLLRIFPSTTFAIERWLIAWWPEHPDATLEWTYWAQRHSDDPARLHQFAAQLLIQRRDYDAAVEQLELALAKAHANMRPRIEPLLRATRIAAARQAANRISD